MKNVIKPKAEILEEKSLIPVENIISPPPNQFTHKLIRTEPFYFNGVQQAAPPDGEFAPETMVILLRHDSGSFCRVADSQGLYVEIQYDSIKKL